MAEDRARSLQYEYKTVSWHEGTTVLVLAHRGTALLCALITPLVAE